MPCRNRAGLMVVKLETILDTGDRASTVSVNYKAVKDGRHLAADSI